MPRYRNPWTPRPPERGYLYKKHGITPKEWWLLYHNQSGACAVCGRTDVPLQVDHDHKIAGKREKDPAVKKAAVRGLLCWMHNQALAAFRDVAQYMRNAAEYIEDPPAGRVWERRTA